MFNCIYLLHSKKRNLCKIGRSKNLKRRVQNLNNENAVSDDWVIIDYVGFLPSRNLHRIEQKIHRRLLKHKAEIRKEYYHETLLKVGGKHGFSFYLNQQGLLCP
jgi:hypothetical protein